MSPNHNAHEKPMISTKHDDEQQTIMQHTKFTRVLTFQDTLLTRGRVPARRRRVSGIRRATAYAAKKLTVAGAVLSLLCVIYQDTAIFSAFQHCVRNST